MKSKKTIWAGHQVTPFFSRGGRLLFFNTHLVFRPYFLDKILFAKEIFISFEEIKKIEISNGPFNLVDDLIIRLKNGKQYWFRIKNANSFIDYIKTNHSEVSMQELNRTQEKKSYTDYLKENKEGVISELVLTSLAVFPVVIFICIFFDMIFQHGFSRNSITFSNFIIENGYIGFFYFSVFCLVVMISISMFRIIFSHFSMFLKIILLISLFVAGVVVVPILHFYFLRKKYSDLYKKKYQGRGIYEPHL